MSKSIDKEILVVETIIKQLRNCIAIYHREKRFDYIVATIKDIQICKTELKRLKVARMAELEAEKGVTTNAAMERSAAVFL